MYLKDQATYTRAGSDTTHRIIGETRHYPKFVYSARGDWYERSTGRFVSMTHNGEYVSTPDNYRNLVAEVNERPDAMPAPDVTVIAPGQVLERGEMPNGFDDTARAIRDSRLTAAGALEHAVYPFIERHAHRFFVALESFDNSENFKDGRELLGHVLLEFMQQPDATRTYHVDTRVARFGNG